MNFIPQLNRLLVVDDDQGLRDRLALILSKKGFDVETAGTLAEAKKILKFIKPDNILLDLKLNDGYGFELIEEAKNNNPDVRIIIFTGYGNIASVVTAMKNGAFNYLAKPADVESIERALKNISNDALPALEPMSPARAKWEHINRIYNDCKFNVSETARRLKMHRRTLQRILAKYAPRV